MDKYVTDEFKNITSTPLNEYPRPQFKRESYYSLNGDWDFKVSKNENDLNSFNEKILVPFCVESIASRINKRIDKGDYLIYHKKFTLDKTFIKDKTFINFIGVDQYYYIILNGKKYNQVIPLGLSSQIDITSSIKEENDLYVICRDDIDNIYPLGKQSKNPKGMFYTPVSGIYFPVFIESVNNGYIENIKITPTLDSIKLDIKSTEQNFNVEIYENDKLIIKKEIASSSTIKIDNPILWDINNPFLYKLVISSSNDVISSYFGLREIKQIDGFIYLNNKKIILNGLLDQGYYPEGIYTPATYNSYLKDITVMKSLGFNMLRKHIKVEAPYFYYLCDKEGMLIMQDFINNSKYSFFKDTALPTIGVLKKSDKHTHKNPLSRKYFKEHYHLLLEQLYNHPSIIAYTIFNEGWGQFLSNEQYHIAKKLDPTRLYDTASGWFKSQDSDFNSYHLYFNKINYITKIKEKPIFVSEFGGFVYKDQDHSYIKGQPFGYKFYKTSDELEKGIISLYEQKIIPHLDKICGLVYTQVSDVENETNGLFTYDRKVLKVSVEKIKNVMNKING